jgi:RNA polymerase sigma-70 factor (ECF subfamily)
VLFRSARPRFRGDSGLYTWLYRILVNLCKDHYKSRSRQGRWLEPAGMEAAPEPAAPTPTSEQVLEARQRDEAVRRALGSLEPRLREILVLRHYEEMSYEQIAATLGCPVGTVRSRLATARERLREAMENQETA